MAVFNSSFWKNLLDHITGPKARVSRSSRPTRRMSLESLEDRKLMATFNVSNFEDVVAMDGKLSLREAINSANLTTEPDTIVMPAGVFRIGKIGVNENNNLYGDFDIKNPLTIVGQGAGKTIVDGARQDRVFELIGSYNATFQKLTIRNGAGAIDGGAISSKTANVTLDDSEVTNSAAFRNGGGIYNESGNVTLNRTTVSRNVAREAGGGVYATGGTTTLRNSTVRNNVANEGGGIVANNATLLSSVVSGNRANFSTGGISAGNLSLTSSTVSGNSAGSSGGINAGNATLMNSTVTNNTAKGGVGGIRASDQLIMTNSTVSGNSAGSDAGGIQANSARLTNSTVSGNSAGEDGGGIFAGGLTMTNSTVSGNTARQLGGGVYVFRGTITNSTITQNDAYLNGGGIYHVPSSGELYVKNTIVADNYAGYDSTLNGGNDVVGAFASQGNNLIGVSAGNTGFTNGVKSDQVGAYDNPIDPMLAPLANNGGPTMTHALLQGSRAIDRGNNGGAPTTDQRGLARIKDGDRNGVGVIDIGAFEL
jgi:predicted outer membrane repeat protein